MGLKLNLAIAGLVLALASPVSAEKVSSAAAEAAKAQAAATAA